MTASLKNATSPLPAPQGADRLDGGAADVSPRNTWARLHKAMTLADAGQVHAARRQLAAVSYSNDLNAEIMAIYRAYVERCDDRRVPVGPINTSADYLGEQSGLLHPPTRRLSPSITPPKPYPPGMALPELVGQRNDTRFLRDAVASLGHCPPKSVRRVHVIYAAGPDHNSDIHQLCSDLDRQDFDGEIGLSLFGPDLGDIHGPGRETLPFALLSEAAAPRLREIAAASDLVVFLSGHVRLDPTALTRAVQVEQVSDAVVQPLIAAPKPEKLQTLLTPGGSAKTRFTTRYPFRDVLGMNMAVSPALLARSGLPDTGFEDLSFAARDLAYRMFARGCYFMPLAVPRVDVGKLPGLDTPCGQRYLHRCPNTWDRKTDGRFDIPKVSVYIPTYKASKYIRRAVDSVLEQDVHDLEVCLADDGSPDDTLDVLEAHYADEPRVRWSSGRNGGIGHASNRAIGMSQALYIGQLDSDDCLKPGAVRTLMDHLDKHPEIACCYGSCERIDDAGTYIKDEYSWPEFSREKMMITSIVHHFRMFRRAAWERTGHFREDIVNAVDYDIFLKLSETGHIHHIDKVLYQRRWHGENTSNVHERFQTANTYRVQREALARQGLDRFWDVYVPDPQEPRRVSYKRTDGKKMVVFWPDYSASNPYQKCLYRSSAETVEYVSGPIEAAQRLIALGNARPEDLTFHLHWLNFLFRDVPDALEARVAIEAFLAKIDAFQSAGGRLIWTIHNTVSHDAAFRDLEIELSARLAEKADVLHFHSMASVEEVAQIFPVPREKVRLARHGNYIGVYPDFISRAAARDMLGLTPKDEVLLFTGQVRPYKGLDELAATFRALLPQRPNLMLLIAGKSEPGLLDEIAPSLTAAERARIKMAERFIDDGELQVFLRAADLAVYPYRNILTSGSLLLALSYGLPAVIPAVGMTREVLEGRDAGALYDAAGGRAELDAALSGALDRIGDPERGPEMRRNAYRIAQEASWQDFSRLL